ncbi:uncharacterized protein LOC126759722 [Bactrocera neohumeralis]|uniref:uncharacterized protein LOC126759722 n=1 Tax=Bactrocera neohumeralis TaxID=98809 RepID=UPI002165B8C0|nr:uncharacterized protein LOC126759722 [Bactrocera neohumeralis]
MSDSSADPIITVTLESADGDADVINLDAATRSLLINGGPGNNLQKHVTSSKNFWIELPQLIIVETRFITQQIAAQNRIYSAQTLLPITDYRFELDAQETCTNAAQTKTPPLLLEVGTLAKPDVVDVEVNTDSPNPCRDRAQQTTKTLIQTAAVGIQCNLDDYLECEEAPTDENELKAKKGAENQQFLTFTQENSIFYLNGRHECMLCGEVEDTMERMLSHLALHWGPAALCHLCGLQFEHRRLMSLHQCKVRLRKSKKRKKVYRQCPVFWCGAVNASTKELNEHLRRHFRMRRRRACVTFTLDQTIVIKRPFYTKTNCLHRCNICLRRYKSSQKFTKHRKRCLRCFIAQMKGQKFVDPLLIFSRK